MKKIALIVDIKNWAFDILSNTLKNNLSDEFQIDIFYCKSDEFNNNLFKLLEAVKDYDLIHFFWRSILLDFENKDFISEVQKKYGDYELYKNRIIKKISFAIFDHLYEDDLEFNRTITKYCNNYVVSTEKLLHIYNNLEGIKKPAGVLEDIFDKKIFYPLNMERFNFDTNDSKLVIGWAGNSTWNSKLKNKDGVPIDFKGFHTVLKPVIDELQNENYNIELYCADKNTNPIPNDKMCEFYSKLHIYICVSNKEGTPRPMIESMGCGVPIITTDVGLANQALGNKQKAYILGERIAGENEAEIRKKLKEKIIYLYNNREVLKELSQENYELSGQFEIERMKKKYSKYFNQLINSTP